MLLYIYILSNNNFIIIIFNSIIEEDKIEIILREAIMENYPANKFKEALEATKLSSSKKKLLLQFWLQEHDKIHDQVIEQSIFGPRFKDIKWRVDQVTNVKELSESTQIAAIIELTTTQQTSSCDNGKSVVIKQNKFQFEVDPITLTETLSKFDDIQTKISQITN